MSTAYSRRAGRLLSLDHGRRTGPQLPLDVASGITPRHAQGWRDYQEDDPRDALAAAHAIIKVGLMCVLAWAVVLGLLILAMEAL
jgi:hypothetical protein